MREELRYFWFVFNDGRMKRLAIRCSRYWHPSVAASHSRIFTARTWDCVDRFKTIYFESPWKPAPLLLQTVNALREPPNGFGTVRYGDNWQGEPF